MDGKYFLSKRPVANVGDKREIVSELKKGSPPSKTVDIKKKMKELFGDDSDEENSIMASEKFRLKMLSPLKSSPGRNKLVDSQKKLPASVRTEHSDMAEDLPAIQKNDSRTFVPCRKYNRTKPITGRRVLKTVHSNGENTDIYSGMRIQSDGVVKCTKEKRCTDGSKRENEPWKPMENPADRPMKTFGVDRDEVNSILASQVFRVKMLSPLKSPPRRDEFLETQKIISIDMSNTNAKMERSDMTEGLPPIQEYDPRNFVPCRKYNRTKPITGKRVQKTVYSNEQNTDISSGTKIQSDEKANSTEQKRCTDGSKRKNELCKPTMEKSKIPADRPMKVRFDKEKGRMNQKTCTNDQVTKEGARFPEFSALKRKYVELDHEGDLPQKRLKLEKAEMNSGKVQTNKNRPALFSDTPPWAARLMKIGLLEDMTGGLRPIQKHDTRIFVPHRRYDKSNPITWKTVQKTIHSNGRTTVEEEDKGCFEFPNSKRKYINVDREGDLPVKCWNLKKGAPKSDKVQTIKDGPAPFRDTPPWAAKLIEMGLLEPLNDSSPIFLPPRKILGPE